MSEFEVRLARPDEFAAIGELTVAAYREDGLLEGHEDYADELRDAAGRAAGAELLAAVDAAGTVLGSVTVVPSGSAYAELARADELEFRMLGVAAAARGRGVGEALTRAVLRRAGELGRARVVLVSLDRMKAAHRLYERIGFARLPERDWAPYPGVLLLAFGYEVA
ncbi:GNAT family N-acetyltransferase [Amycolatopsis sp. CA-230715]|uniref:GNAT family N-acetyltransferase n=1 Tax=Amycolatopsis sp. CA-230715 TaxID=2745196 RepID=UPI001C0132D0|nr:GNAT family N-acetyltransferase [Amycolatopsis sp. CA-230715]QWF83359.1 Mycothiol acetyltransferase [Amycolatopsis sp. CA-230715]